MEKIEARAIFAQGPAPPGHRPPNTSLFNQLEHNMLSMSRRIKNITARIARLRSAHRVETCTAMRVSIKEEVMQSIRDQIRARELMARYCNKLKALQEAEILKVVKHMNEIDKDIQMVCRRLAILRLAIKRATDPDDRHRFELEAFAVNKEQEKARDLRERWRIRLVQMQTAKFKELTPHTNTIEAVSQKITTPQPKPDTKCIERVETTNISKKIPTPKPDTKTTNKVVAENISNKALTPMRNTETKFISKAVVLNTKKTIDKKQTDKKDCKRCVFLQRANKTKKNLPKFCNVCLKWAHRVLQDGVGEIPKVSGKLNKSTDSGIAVTQTVQPDTNIEFGSTIKVEIEPLTNISLIKKDVTQLVDQHKSSNNIEIQPLDASMNDEIMSDVIEEDKTESINFDEVTSIQDALKTIDDTNTALAHVRILQEYAMLNDNYRAIGLLSQVEKAFINPPKREDFEC